MQHFKSLIVIGLTCLALTACGSSGDDDDILPTPDAGVHVGPDAMVVAASCMTDLQDCPDPNQKCTVSIDTSNNWSTVCRDIHENAVGIDVACMRDSDGNTGVGRDNCDKLGYCTALGNPDGTFGIGFQTCRQFCRATSQCDGTHECMTLTDLVPADGICIDSCTALGTDTCTDGAWCEPKDNIQLESRGICVKGGTLTLGQTCGGAVADDCATNLLCVSHPDMTSTCDQVCDLAGTQVTCPQDPVATTCTMIGNFATDYGVCIASTLRGNSVKYSRPVQSLLRR
jgi:hypothetical protein